MAEIDNSLAASVRPLDIAGTLARVTQIREMNLRGDLSQQALQHNEREYQENNGLTAAERSTMADTQAKNADLNGRLGNMILSGAPRDEVIRAAESWGMSGNAMQKHQLQTMPENQWQAYGAHLQSGGQSSTTNIQQSGIPARNERRATSDMDLEGLDPNKPYASRASITGVEPTQRQLGAGGPTRAQVDNAITSRRNFDGSPRVLSTADIVSTSPPQPDLPRGSSQPSQRLDNVTNSGSPFQPRVVRGADGTVSSSVNPETTGMQQSAVERFKQMQDTAGSAQGLHSQLDAIEHDNEMLNSSGWSSTGAGANAKMSAAKSINSLFETFGVKAPIDPTKVASWEGYNKQTIRAGFELARTLGGHQAESVVQSSVNATPNVENTYFGSKVITNSIRQTVQREVDMYNYALKKAQATGSSFGAEAEFNAKYPPKLYSQTAVANAIPSASIERLTSSDSPKTRAQFDAAFGKGMADFVLQRARQ